MGRFGLLLSLGLFACGACASRPLGASTRYGIRVSSWDNPEISADYTAAIGEAVEIPGTTLRLTPIRYLPDFAYSFERRTVESRSDSPVNPALLVALSDAEGSRDEIWLFEDRPNFRQRERLAYRLVFLGPGSDAGPREETR